MTRPMPGPPEPVPHEFDRLPHVRRSDPWDYCSGCAAENRMRLVDPKRLTNAECAAEYWQAEVDARDHAIAIDYGMAPDHDMPVLVADTWHRFAACPHYNEENA